MSANTISKISDNEHIWKFQLSEDYFHGERIYNSDKFVIDSETGKSEWKLEGVWFVDYDSSHVKINIELVSVSGSAMYDGTVFQVTILSMGDGSGTLEIPAHNTGDKIYLCSSLTKDLDNILTNKEFSDVTLVAQDGIELKAHKLMLCARSQVFAAMFRNDMEESKTNRIRIDDMSAEVIKGMLRYIYTGYAGDYVPCKLAKELFIAANKYALFDLQTMCENILINTMNRDTVTDTLLLADRHANERLKNTALQFIAYNIEAIKGNEPWKKLRQTNHELCMDVLEKTIEERL
ncbi:protein roadkill-like [Musca autumnalis]|uniref:protein roadkill-like n=1 Tax=Musca autumnalis TaxID=221902 RepID=UPI003CE93C07